MRKGIRGIKRGIAVLLSACMVFGMTPIQAGAEETGEAVVSENEMETKSVQSENNVQTHDSAEVDTATSVHYDDNGFCKGYEIDPNGTGAWVKKSGADACTDEGCEGYQPADKTVGKYDYDNDASTDDAVYEIGNAGQLYWFAAQVKSGNNAINAILTGNITVNEKLLASLTYDTNGNVSNGGSFRSWTPIGDYKNIYSGTFDGNNNTVSGLYLNDSKIEGGGLFGVSQGAIKNVGVVDSYFRGYRYVAGICGDNNDANGAIVNCYNTGTIEGIADVFNSLSFGGVCGDNWGEITDCYNSGAVSASSCAGGICGANNNKGSVKNCYNTGKVTLISEKYSVGGICGKNVSNIANCFNTGKVSTTVSNGAIGSICGYNWSTATAINCYYLADTEEENGGKTSAQFESGEVAYTLNQGNSDATTDTWKQNIDAEGKVKDSTPTLNEKSSTVYRYNSTNCAGNDKNPLVYGYTNDVNKNNTNVNDPHTYAPVTENLAQHKCSECGGTEAHTFTYNKADNGNAIVATCSECGATYTVKVTKPAAASDGKIVYDGTAKKVEAAIESGNTGIETIPESAITYAAVTDAKTSDYSTNVPKDAGTYKAKLTLGTRDNAVSIETEFTIEQATPTIAWSENQTNQSATYIDNMK